MVVSKRNLLFQGAPIFRGYVNLLVSGRLTLENESQSKLLNNVIQKSSNFCGESSRIRCGKNGKKSVGSHWMLEVSQIPHICKWYKFKYTSGHKHLRKMCFCQYSWQRNFRYPSSEVANCWRSFCQVLWKLQSHNDRSSERLFPWRFGRTTCSWDFYHQKNQWAEAVSQKNLVGDLRSWLVILDIDVDNESFFWGGNNSYYLMDRTSSDSSGVPFFPCRSTAWVRTHAREKLWQSSRNMTVLTKRHLFDKPSQKSKFPPNRKNCVFFGVKFLKSKGFVGLSCLPKKELELECHWLLYLPSPESIPM